MTDSVLTCPRCFEKALLHVGGYVYAADGLPEGSEIPLDNVFVSQRLYRCTKCEAHVQENEVAQGDEKSQKAIHWETSVRGRRIPLVCPVCKNTQHFVRDSLVVGVQEQAINITAEGGIHQEYAAVTPTFRETIPLVYRCGMSECSGSITINEDTFRTLPQM